MAGIATAPRGRIKTETRLTRAKAIAILREAQSILADCKAEAKSWKRFKENRRLHRILEADEDESMAAVDAMVKSLDEPEKEGIPGADEEGAEGTDTEKQEIVDAAVGEISDAIQNVTDQMSDVVSQVVDVVSQGGTAEDIVGLGYVPDEEGSPAEMPEGDEEPPKQSESLRRRKAIVERVAALRAAAKGGK